MPNADTCLIADYCAHQTVRGFSTRTVERRRWSLGTLAAAGPLAEHTPETVERWMAQWPAASSRQAVRSDARQFYRWAIRRRLLSVNPTDEVDAPSVQVGAATPLDLADLQRVLQLANLDQRRAIMLGAYAGLRATEIANLQCSDVHRDLGLIVVRSGKGGRSAVVPLHPRLGAVLPLTGPAVPYDDRGAVYRAIKRAFRAAGVTARPHDLRHTFATEAARRSNGNAYDVAKLMRHASIATTQRYVKWGRTGADVVLQMYA